MGDSTCRQQGALFFCALSVPAVMLFPSVHPAAVIGFAVLAAALWRAVPADGVSDWHGGRGLAAAEWGTVLLCVVWLAAAVRLTAAAYPSASNRWSMGLILLAAAGYAVRNGIKPLLRASAICFYFNVVICAAVAAFGLKGIGAVYPADRAGRLENNLSLAWMLLPLAAFWLPKETGGGKRGGWRWAWAVLAVAPCLICWLNLSPAIASEDSFPFYTLAKSISVFGVMERFEVLLSAALTTGIFCLMGILWHICGNILQRRVPRLGAPARSIVIFLFVAAASLLNSLCLHGAIALLSPIFWGFVPLVTQWIVAVKKT